VRILRFVGCIVFTVIGIVLLREALSAILKLSQLSTLRLVGPTGELLMAIIAFAAAWECIKKRP
jgi:hypothetical protein